MEDHFIRNRVDVTRVANLATSDERKRGVLNQIPVTLWLTGLSGAGKSTLGFSLERALLNTGKAAFVLDGDNIRCGLNRDLSFTPRDRAENIRRTAEVARLMNEAGLIVIVSLISPYSEDRRRARDIIGEQRFREVYLSATLSVCEARDPKGLYRKARAGEIESFTGVSAPYQIPQKPDLELNTGVMSVTDCVERMLLMFN
ncbi:MULTISPECIES: adenylyl-sulfate kinase [Pseudomonadaceae]|jgi:adenylylsulfate kinase|uniref:Adenylyl-sulfate kinase n=1 Tax=Stutzerimonas stutzeri (strain A1501) TaxID=379731 RepID=A4VJE0_STUS1|nr:MULTISPECIES: adenylyl-sulfate kinase [Pseudomonadaceae]HAJ86334.1 adenylyl-sulfate kinase [Pseudomonas sp.]ABP79091.1 adenylylsulfate kinase [Stutzerimonas stutzeri A1501]MBE7375377.1 adenylyl-sulfate kinase [Pseudomonas lopnurensis]MCP3433486.1 adenylyl-sulfate kinase [Stutzerimonas stutzeri]RRV82703.1 adenylyl-sulfate kinase [Stutzerimonas stutzeri]